MNIIEQVYSFLEVADPLKENHPGIHNIKKWLISEFEEMEEGISSKNKREVINGVADQLFVAINSAYYEGITIEELQNEIDLVYKSNMTKYCKSEEEAIESCNLYKDGLHPNKIGVKIETDYKKVGEYWVIRKVSDGKIMKSHLFKDVDKV